jgi:hypothetical protein
VWVKGLQCGSTLAMRTRDPPIIQVEIPTPMLESKVITIRSQMVYEEAGRLVNEELKRNGKISRDSTGAWR